MCHNTTNLENCQTLEKRRNIGQELANTLSTSANIHQFWTESHLQISKSHNFGQICSPTDFGITQKGPYLQARVRCKVSRPVELRRIEILLAVVRLVSGQRSLTSPPSRHGHARVVAVQVHDFLLERGEGSVGVNLSQKRVQIRIHEPESYSKLVGARSRL